MLAGSGNAGGKGSAIRDLAHQQQIDGTLNEVPSQTIARQAAEGFMDAGQAAWGGAVSQNGGLDTFYTHEGPPAELNRHDFAVAIAGEGAREAAGNRVPAPHVKAVTSAPPPLQTGLGYENGRGWANSRVQQAAQDARKAKSGKI